MDTLLFLIIIIALLSIIILIILYNGLRISLKAKKEKSDIEYQFLVSLLKIPIFKRSSDDEKDEEEEEEEEPYEDDEEEKGLKELYEDIKPILQGLKESKNAFKPAIKGILKSLDFKKLCGHLKLGLSDSMMTVKISSFIWAVGAIVNPVAYPASLTVEPVFTEEVIDFDVEVELRVNLLRVLIVALELLSKKEIRPLIRAVLDYIRED